MARPEQIITLFRKIAIQIFFSKEIQKVIKYTQKYVYFFSFESCVIDKLLYASTFVYVIIIVYVGLLRVCLCLSCSLYYFSYICPRHCVSQ